MGVIIHEDKCIGCALCLVSCAYDAIEVAVKAAVDNSKCTDCLACIDYCPTDAITLDVENPAKTMAFDVVIIGGGVGGLAAAAGLVQAGYRTVIVERAPSTGGRFSSLQHRGVKYPTGVFYAEKGGIIEETFREIGAEYDVVTPEPQYKFWLNGRIVDPGDGVGRLRRALNGLTGDPDEVNKVLEAIKSAIRGPRPPGLAAMTARQWLDIVTDNEVIKGTFQAIVGTQMCLNYYEVSAEGFLNFFGLGGQLVAQGVRYGYPRNGALSLMRELGRAITRRGGVIWTRTEAHKIVVEGGRARAVLVTHKGKPLRLDAPVIISDTGPRVTARLVGMEHMDHGYGARLEGDYRPCSLIFFHIESQEPLLPFPSVLYTVGLKRLVCIGVPSLLAQWAPGGVHVAEGYGTLTNTLDPSTLARDTEETLAELDLVVPGWRAKQRHCVVGSFYGDWPVYRGWAGTTLPVETPIPNLFNVGDGVRAPGWEGSPSAVESARRVVEAVKASFPLNR